MMPTYKTFIGADVLMLLLPAAIGGWLTHGKPVSAHFKCAGYSLDVECAILENSGCANQIR